MIDRDTRLAVTGLGFRFLLEYLAVVYFWYAYGTIFGF